MKKLSSPSSLFPLLLLLATAHPQQPWQHLSNPTAAEVLHTWAAPPPEYGPEPYYGLNGPADITVVRRDLDTMHTLGYQGVTVQYGYGETFAYLSPEYFAFFKQFVAEAKARNMRIWIVDDAGYPSGFAGGKFSELHPELRMQALVTAARIPATAGQHIQQSVPADTVAVTALSTDNHSVTIPVTNGSIDWTAPAGSWTISIVQHIFSTSPTRSDTNPKRVKDGSQSLEDYLDPAATAQYLAFTHEAYKQAVGDEFGKTILGFRGDEPDYSIGGLPWTPRFFDKFQQAKGYDIRPYLAAFTPNEHHPGQKDAPPAALTDRERRAKADYYDVFSQLFRDGFFKPQAVWCAQNHLEYQVHLNHEEMEMQLVHSEGSFFRDMQYVQVPGIDSIWHQIWTDTISDFPRLASSAAHLYGHPRAFTESFAAYRPAPDLPLVKYILDEQFVRGINLVETMYFPASSTPRGPNVNDSTPAANTERPRNYMQDPAYPALLTYVRRMSFLLSQGKPAASVALYLPSASMWLGDAASDTQFVSTERLLSEHQIDFDIIDEDFLSITDKSSTIAAASGNMYHTVIIPNAAVLDASALTRLQAFAKAGNKVLFLGRTPALISGKTILDARPSTPADFAFATIVPATLPETPTPPAQPPTSAPEPMQVPPQMLAALATLPAQDVTLASPTTAVRMLHRQLADSTVYLFFNESPTPVTTTLNFRTRPQHAELWHPDTASTTPLDPTHTPLNLPAYSTAVIVVH